MNGVRLNVCHVIQKLGPGGAERVLVELAQVAQSADLDMTVVSLLDASEAVHAGELRDLGIEVQSLGVRGLTDPRAFPRGISVIRRLAPDVIHTHMKHADLVGAVAARRLGVPMVSTIHVIEDAPGPGLRVKGWLGGQARMRVAARTVTVSEAVRAWYLSTFPADPDRVVTVHNGVVPAVPGHDERKARRAEIGVPEDAVMVTMVGIMRPGKGHAELLAALREVPRTAGIHFVLVGDGPLRPGLESQARELSGPSSSPAIFTGYRTDVDALLGASDILVHPSLFDALPTVLIQGLANGLPIIASDVGGIPEIVTPGVGVLVPPGDSGRLADAVMTLAQDPQARKVMGVEARVRFETEFDARIWANRLRRVYDTASGAAAET